MDLEGFTERYGSEPGKDDLTVLAPKQDDPTEQVGLPPPPPAREPRLPTARQHVARVHSGARSLSRVARPLPQHHVINAAVESRLP